MCGCELANVGTDIFLLKQNHEVINIWYLSHCIAFDAQQPFSANLKGLEWFYVQSVFTFNVSINRVEIVNFVMPARHKHSAHLRSARLAVLQVYKLTKTHQLQRHQLIKLSTYKFKTPSTYKINSPSTRQLNSPSTYTFINL